MMTLILGGSGSGKSAYAEDYLTALAHRESSHKEEKYYLAAMQPFDEESRKRIARHRQLRKGKGFCTIEQPVDIEKAAEHMGADKKTALLECISNLTANEMFAEALPKPEEEVAEKIIKGILFLKERLTHLVIVSNNVFEDGNIYEETTMAYIRAMGRINEKLAKMADEVIEVVVGIPVILKGREKGREDSCRF